ncbi:hypothetical protein KVR01_006639 [Diaporthe batatas]|uniref:uncharacterized protein n=1 Tax=Diaporthe batatas TaxID=748121 RepID=UPI001D03CFD9|nr:uncharacterized protein KVR01_006639 [Diaporthe batatas]KAG8163342.1 hypothetical protein KVR01_006639 [Diaporthe batatas]
MCGLSLKFFNKSETPAQARRRAEAFRGARSNLTTHVRTADVEIGNEPDFYGYAYNVQGHIRFDDRQTSPRLSPGPFIVFVAPGWSVDGAVMTGILDKAVLLSATAQFCTHLGSSSFSLALQFAPVVLLNKEFIHSNLTTESSETKAAKAYGVNHSRTEAKSLAKYVAGIPSIHLTALVLSLVSRRKANSKSRHALLIVNEAMGLSEGDVILEEVRGGMFKIQASKAVLLDLSDLADSMRQRASDMTTRKEGEMDLFEGDRTSSSEEQVVLR